LSKSTKYQQARKFRAFFDHKTLHFMRQIQQLYL